MKPAPRIPANLSNAESGLLIDYFCWAADQARAGGLADDHIEVSVEHSAMRSILVDVIHGVTADKLADRYASLVASPKGSIERLIYEGALLIREGYNSEAIRRKLLT